MITVKENEVYKREREHEFSKKETITFKIPHEFNYIIADYDWYMCVALEKSDLIKEDRHLLTGELLINYRCAIREGFNHELDPALKKAYDFPRNKNTVQGIQKYIEKIQKAQEKQQQGFI